MPICKNLPPKERGSGGEGDLTQYAAVRLFIARAQAAKADFTVTNATAPAVAEICYRLDGLPLAIELAAARSKLFAPEALLARLALRLRLLTGGARDLPARHQTIRGAIDWSYELLDAGEQALFARLGVFVGGCTLEAAEAVLRREGRGEGEASAISVLNPQSSVLDELAALADKSLLRQDEGADGEPRFVMLETIREYALERLEQSGEAEAVRRLHAAYYLGQARASVPKLRGAEQLAWLDRIEAEHDNLRAALAWSQTRREGAEIGLQLTGARGWFWFIRGYWTEGRAWLTDALTGTVEADRSSARAQALSSAGLLTFYLGDYATAQSMLEQSVMLWRELGDQQGLAYALQYLANVPGSLGDYALCRILLEESVALFRAVADDWGLTQSLSYLGNLTLAQGDYTSARRLLEESLAISRPQGYTWNSAVSLRILGDIARAQGDYAVARTTFEESLALCWATRDKSEAALAQLGLARVMWYQGAYEQAQVAYEDGLALCRELGDKEITALLLNSRGEMARYARDYVQAAAWYDQSLSLERELGNKARIANVLHNLGHVMLYQGDVPGAIKSFMESLTLQQERGDTRRIVQVLAGLGGLAGARGQPERATRLLGASAALFEHLDVHLERVDQFEFDRYVAAVRAQLDEAIFAAAWAAGRALTLEQAVAEALAGDNR
jgi:predicted ATPase/Tfp pilus assembly protein PilF